MNATEAQLFNPVFIDFLQQYFERDPARHYDITEVVNDMPSFYKEGHLISAGIQLLSRKNILISRNIEGRDRYQISPDTVRQMQEAKENERLNKEIDMEIKRKTLDALKWDRVPKKFWWLIAIITFMLGGFIDFGKDYIKSKYFEKTNASGTPKMPVKVDSNSVKH